MRPRRHHAPLALATLATSVVLLAHDACVARAATPVKVAEPDTGGGRTGKD